MPTDLTAALLRAARDADCITDALYRLTPTNELANEITVVPVDVGLLVATARKLTPAQLKRYIPYVRTPEALHALATTDRRKTTRKLLAGHPFIGAETAHLLLKLGLEKDEPEVIQELVANRATPWQIVLAELESRDEMHWGFPWGNLEGKVVGAGPEAVSAYLRSTANVIVRGDLVLLLTERAATGGIEGFTLADVLAVSPPEQVKVRLAIACGTHGALMRIPVDVDLAEAVAKHIGPTDDFAPGAKTDDTLSRGQKRTVTEEAARILLTVPNRHVRRWLASLEGSSEVLNTAEGLAVPDEDLAFAALRMYENPHVVDQILDRGDDDTLETLLDKRGLTTFAYDQLAHWVATGARNGQPAPSDWQFALNRADRLFKAAAATMSTASRLCVLRAGGWGFTAKFLPTASHGGNITVSEMEQLLANPGRAFTLAPQRGVPDAEERAVVDRAELFALVQGAGCSPEVLHLLCRSCPGAMKVAKFTDGLCTYILEELRRYELPDEGAVEAAVRLLTDSASQWIGTVHELVEFAALAAGADPL